MRIGGKEIPKGNEVIVPIIRGADTVILIAKSIPINKEFDAIVPEPKPPQVLKPGGLRINNVDDPKYKKLMDERNNLRFPFLIIRSLTSPEGIEWDTVKLDDPSTWNNWKDELESNGFTDAEIGRIIKSVCEANGLDDELIKQKRDDFLLSTLQESQE